MAKFRQRRNGDDMTRIARNLILALSVATVLAACGRKGELQRPAPPADIQKDSSGKSADPNRPFFLDPLLGK
jgi:predicted small lipoprotein YifL